MKRIIFSTIFALGTMTNASEPLPGSIEPGKPLFPLSQAFLCEVELRGQLLTEMATAVGTWNSNPESLAVNERILITLMSDSSQINRILKEYCKQTTKP